MATDDLRALLTRFQRRADGGSAEHAAIVLFLFGVFRLFSGDFAKRFMTHADDFEINSRLRRSRSLTGVVPNCHARAR